MTSKKPSLIIILCFTIPVCLMTACKKSDHTEERFPVVATLEISEISPESALGGGDILSDGNDKIISRGIVWDTKANPDVDNYSGKNEEGMWAGVFHSRITGLDAEETYYVRAYATNSFGTTYGDDVVFTTLKANTAADIEGNIYQTVRIGNQEWFATNLRVTRFSDGTPIPGDLTCDEWRFLTKAGYRIYPHDQITGINSDDEMKMAYGVLYNWYAAENERGLCPKAGGWRVATNEDWNSLFTYVSENYAGNVADRLKSCRQVDSPFGGDCAAGEHPRWDYHDIHSGTDDVGFGALSAGFYDWTCVYEAIGTATLWWCADKNPQTGRNQYIYLRYDAGDVFTSENYVSMGLSVRCVRDVQLP